MGEMFQARYLSELLEALKIQIATENRTRLLPMWNGILENHWPQRSAQRDLGDAVALDLVENLLSALDELLTAGSGQSLERAFATVAQRSIAALPDFDHKNPLRVQLAELRSYVLRPFLGASITYSQTNTTNGVRVFLGVGGRPRATRLLAHSILGHVEGACRFSVTDHSQILHAFTDYFGDRARVDVQFRMQNSRPLLVPKSTVIARTTRNSSTRPPRPSLAEEVANILGTRDPDRRSCRPPSAGVGTSALALAQLRREGSASPPSSSLPPWHPFTGWKPTSPEESPRLANPEEEELPRAKPGRRLKVGE